MNEVPLGSLDPQLLRRRVVLVAVVVVPLFLAVSYTIAWLDLRDGWLVIAMVLIYLLVIRPLMRPVREAIKLRRRLAYEAWLEDKARREP